MTEMATKKTGKTDELWKLLGAQAEIYTFRASPNQLQYQDEENRKIWQRASARMIKRNRSPMTQDLRQEIKEAWARTSKGCPQGYNN